MSKLTVEVASGTDVFEDLRPAWQQLHRESECSPFVSWEWMSSWHRSCGKGSEPVVLRILAEERLLGLLPLRSTGHVLTFMGNGSSGADHLDVIARGADRDRVAAAVAEFVGRNGADALILDELAPSSPLRGALRMAAKRDRSKYFERASYICPHVDLKAGWHAVLGRSRRASNFKRRFRQAEGMSGFQFRSVSLPAELNAAFERFLILHKGRWATTGVSDLSGRSDLVEFHREVVSRMAATGSVRFDELWIGGQCVASIYGFDDGRTFFYFNAGFDPAWSGYSVGLVLLGLSIRAACDRGRTKYDLLRGDETYKWDWANGSETLVKACLVANTFAGRAFAIREGLEHHVRGISRAVLPAAARERLRAWRHGDVRPAAQVSA